mgnify:CR=1 FL=1
MKIEDIICEKTEKGWSAYLGFVIYDYWPIEKTGIKARKFLRGDALTKKEAIDNLCNAVLQIFEDIKNENR